MHGRPLRGDRLAGLAVVLALHGLVFYGLWSARLIPVHEEAATLFVNFITPQSPPLLRQKETAQSVKVEKPRPPEPRRQLVVNAPAAASDKVIPPPPPEPVVEAPQSPPVAAPRPLDPVSLSGELALACPTRTPPAYPALSRRMGETGKVVLRVELDTDGRVDTARIASSSSYTRLDEAALNAVKTWRCNPPSRDGQPVRAVALQPFKFNLE